MIRSILLSALLLASSSFAAEEATVVFTGQTSETVDLSSVLYREEVRERSVTRTCYRDEFRGHRRVCGPYPHPRRPYPPTPGGCRMIPIYVRVAYPCTIVERDVVRVFDANVDARVNFTFGDVPAGITPRESLKVKLDGDRLSVDVDGSGALLVTSKETRASSRSGNTVNLTSDHALTFRDAAQLSASFGDGVSNLSMKGKALTFKMAESSRSLPTKLRLKIVRKRALADDRVVFDQEFSRDRLTAGAASAGKTTYTSPLSALGVSSLSDGKYKVTLFAEVDFAGETILNRDEIAGKLKDSASLELKVK